MKKISSPRILVAIEYTGLALFLVFLGLTLFFTGASIIGKEVIFGIKNSPAIIIMLILAFGFYAVGAITHFKLKERADESK